MCFRAFPKIEDSAKVTYAAGTDLDSMCCASSGDHCFGTPGSLARMAPVIAVVRRRRRFSTPERPLRSVSVGACGVVESGYGRGGYRPSNYKFVEAVSLLEPPTEPSRIALCHVARGFSLAVQLHNCKTMQFGYSTRDETQHVTSHIERLLMGTAAGLIVAGLYFLLS